MRMIDLIAKKRDGKRLEEQEIRWMIQAYVNEEIPDYQMSAMLMAIYLKGMNDEETAILTDSMAHSGDIIDLSQIQGIKVDKHSTGGVGDKTTLIVAPIVASLGVKVAKMSGRGLGHTGGTVDKLESIPGLKMDISREKFFQIVNDIGVSVVGQSGNLAPADKKLYALRDVTGTVESIPLIASSIMSKKIAAGSDCILLDVKCGNGAFMKHVEEAVCLGEKMVAIGQHSGKTTIALITDMNIPLGNNIGNSLEVMEAVETLEGHGPEDLTNVSIELAANMLLLAKKGTIEQCRIMATQAIKNGSAKKCLEQMVAAQGGTVAVIRDCKCFPKAPFEKQVLARQEGYIVAMDTQRCGIASCMLGAGRKTKESKIDYSAGIILKKKVYDYVKEGEVLAVMYASKEAVFEEAYEELYSCYTFSEENISKKPLILARIENVVHHACEQQE